MLVAEIGNNHMGSEERAGIFLDALFKTGVDAITFQIREASFYDGTRPYKNPLSKDFIKQAIERCKKSGKKIGFAVADTGCVDFLNSEGADFWKTLSWDILNKELQEKLKDTGKKVFISTGVSGMEDIITASAWHDNIAFIHTQLDYDAGKANLKALHAMKTAVKKDIAFGSHCENKNIFYAALAFEPSDIFFYVKGDDCEAYPDDKHAILLSEVENLAVNIRILERALGDGDKIAMNINL